MPRNIGQSRAKLRKPKILSCLFFHSNRFWKLQRDHFSFFVTRQDRADQIHVSDRCFFRSIAFSFIVFKRQFEVVPKTKMQKTKSSCIVFEILNSILDLPSSIQKWMDLLKPIPNAKRFVRKIFYWTKGGSILRKNH